MSVGVLRILIEGGLKVALGGAVIAGQVSGFAGAGKCLRIGGVVVENFAILLERTSVVLRLHEELGGLQVSNGVGRQRGGEGHKLRFCVGECVFLQQELNEFDAGVGAIGIGIGVPDSIHGIVIV